MDMKLSASLLITFLVACGSNNAQPDNASYLNLTYGGGAPQRLMQNLAAVDSELRNEKNNRIIRDDLDSDGARNVQVLFDYTAELSDSLAICYRVNGKSGTRIVFLMRSIDAFFGHLDDEGYSRVTMRIFYHELGHAAGLGHAKFDGYDKIMLSSVSVLSKLNSNLISEFVSDLSKFSSTGSMPYLLQSLLQMEPERKYNENGVFTID